jgi:hypothetical protein
MTELLEQAIAQLKTRPISEQDSIAALILEELNDDNHWADASDVHLQSISAVSTFTGEDSGIFTRLGRHSGECGQYRHWKI